MISRAGLIGTDVKSALTSYDTIASSGPNVMPFRCSMKSWLLLMWCGDFPIRGLRILGNSFGVEKVTAPMLETMGLNGVPSL